MSLADYIPDERPMVVYYQGESDFEAFIDKLFEKKFKVQHVNDLDELKLLTAEDVSKIVDFSMDVHGRSMVDRFSDRDWCAKRGVQTLPYYRIGNKKRYDKKDVTEFLEQFKTS